MKDKMKATYQYRQKVKDVPGKFLTKWPTFFKPRVIAKFQNLPQRTHIDELLLSAQQESDDNGKWKSGDWRM